MRKEPEQGCIWREPPWFARLVWSDKAYSVRSQRFVMDSFCKLFPAPGKTRFRHTEIGGVPCRWILGFETPTPRLIVHLHGGGFMTGSSHSHRSMAANLCRMAGARGLAVDYRLAPEHPYPAALEDVLAVWRRLMDAGVPPASTALSGDSAGGGLALSLMMALRDNGEPLPAAAFLLSPWCDLTDVYRPVRLMRGGADYGFAHWLVDYLRGMYVRGHDPSDPYISPALGNFTGLPPLHIAVGRQEVLYRDARLVRERAAAAGVEVHLATYRGPIHVAPFLAPVSSWAAHHLQKGAQFLRDHTAPAG